MQALNRGYVFYLGNKGVQMAEQHYLPIPLFLNLLFLSSIYYGIHVTWGYNLCTGYTFSFIIIFHICFNLLKFSTIRYVKYQTRIMYLFVTYFIKLMNILSCKILQDSCKALEDGHILLFYECKL
jgi:hypothetical protein